MKDQEETNKIREDLAAQVINLNEKRDDILVKREQLKVEEMANQSMNNELQQLDQRRQMFDSDIQKLKVSLADKENILRNGEQ